MKVGCFTEQNESRQIVQERTPPRDPENVPSDRESIVVIGVPSQRATLVINYPSDSSSGDSASNRGKICYLIRKVLIRFPGCRKVVIANQRFHYNNYFGIYYVSLE